MTASTRNKCSGDLAVDLVDASGLASLKDEWIRLFDEAEPDNVFLSFEWAEASCRHLGDRARPVIAIARCRERLVGVAPMMIAPVKPWGRQLKFLGLIDPDYGDFLASREDHERIIAALWRGLLREAGFDGVDLSGVCEDAGCLPATRTVLSEAGQLTDEVVAQYLFVELEGDFERYFKSRSKKTRQQINYYRNRLGREHVGINFWRRGSVDADTLCRMFDIHAARWRSKIGIGMFDHQHIRLFFLDLADSLSRRGWLDVAGVDCEGELIGFRFGIRLQGTLFDYITAFHPDYADYRLGSLLLEHVIRGCFDAGLRRFDFMIGSEPYKEKWATGRRDGRRLVCRLPGFAVRHALQDSAKSTRKCLKRIKDRSPLLQVLWRKAARLG